MIIFKKMWVEYNNLYNVLVNFIIEYKHKKLEIIFNKYMFINKTIIKLM